MVIFTDTKKKIQDIFHKTKTCYKYVAADNTDWRRESYLVTLLQYLMVRVRKSRQPWRFRDNTGNQRGAKQKLQDNTKRKPQVLHTISSKSTDHADANTKRKINQSTIKYGITIKCYKDNN